MIDFGGASGKEEGTRPWSNLQSVSAALRPILMTTMAALLGAMPRALGTGVGSELPSR